MALICIKKFAAYSQLRAFYNYTRAAWKSTQARPAIDGEWQATVGLEVHAQILSASKLFSGAAASSAAPANTCVALLDASVPGTLPVLNRRCVEAAVLTALALRCTINDVCLFDRKHYFYADLPAGYQITQQRQPLAHSGEVHFLVFTPGIHSKPYTWTSRIQQLQLEQDSAKSLHDDEAHRSLVDLNRAGVPLMELVFEPDLRDGEEAAALVRELVNILRRLGACSCRMEEGALRVDANVSVSRRGEPPGVRTEIKNIGSVRGVANAVRHEIRRQKCILQGGRAVANETRAWDAQSKQTVPMRDKEEKQDYRFMPEPNLPPLRLNVDGTDGVHPGLVDVRQLRAALPEMPEATRRRLVEEFNLPLESAIVLVNDDMLLSHFTTVMDDSRYRDARLTANLLIMDLLSEVNRNRMSLQDCPVTSSMLGEIVDLLQRRDINLLTARKLLREAVQGSLCSPVQVVQERGWTQVSDPAELHTICRRVLDANMPLVQQYRAGKNKVLGALVGQVAEATGQRADMAAAVRHLKGLLDGEAGGAHYGHK